MYRRLNDVDKAMQSLNKAIHLSSDHKKLILMRKERALLKRKLGDYYGAMYVITIAEKLPISYSFFTCTPPADDKSLSRGSD